MSIENLFSQLAISGASMVGKAAFSYATSVAVKKISTLLTQQQGPSSTELSSTSLQHNHHQLKQLTKLNKKLTRHFSMVSPAIDRCEWLASQGRTALIPMLDMINSVRSSVSDIMDELYLLTSSDASNQDLGSLIEIIEETLEYITELVPFLQLGLLSQPSDSLHYISPSRLLQASRALPSETNNDNLSMDITVYSLFQGSVRPKSFLDFTWKEEISRAFIKLQKRVSSVDESQNGKEILDYELVIKQNLDDERYHDEHEDPTEKVIPLKHIRKTYFASSGQLLNIEDATSAVLVLKVDECDDSNMVLMVKDGVSTPSKNPKNMEWYAFGLFKNCPLSPDEEEDYARSDKSGSAASSSSEENESQAQNNLIKTKLYSKSKQKTNHVKPFVDPGGLSKLDYMLRLAHLEIYKQQSHLVLDDDLLRLFLLNTHSPSNINNHKLSSLDCIPLTTSDRDPISSSSVKSSKQQTNLVFQTSSSSTTSRKMVHDSSLNRTSSTGPDSPLLNKSRKPSKKTLL